MINEVLSKFSDEGLVERRRVGGKGFFRRTDLGASTGRQLKTADDLSISGTFAVGEDGMTWKPERGNPNNFDELIGQNHRMLKSGHQSQEIFVDLWKTISSGNIWKGEIKNRAKDGIYSGTLNRIT